MSKDELNKKIETELTQLKQETRSLCFFAMLVPD